MTIDGAVVGRQQAGQPVEQVAFVVPELQRPRQRGGHLR